jgi:alcohol dehydrogenase class IV
MTSFSTSGGRRAPRAALALARGLALALLTLLARPAAAQWVTTYDQFYYPAAHNWVYRDRYPFADRLFNAFDYGHSILYEELYTKPNAPASRLEERQYNFLTRKVLPNPPRVPLEEVAIEIQYARMAPEAKQMFEWAHVLHRQSYDVLADERLSQAQKDEEMAKLLAYYKSRPDVKFSSRPKSMKLMQEQPYSLAFRKQYPKFNGLIWGYHWLQVGLYEPLVVGRSFAERQALSTAAVARFRQMLENAPRQMPYQMPMTAAVSPEFAKRYPEYAIIFDNLHSMHDVVSDVLANDAVPRSAKRAEILRAGRLFRDDSSYVMPVEAWRTMSREMGVENMGGSAAGFAAALPTPTVSYGAVMSHDDRTGRMVGMKYGETTAGHGATHPAGGAAPGAADHAGMPGMTGMQHGAPRPAAPRLRGGRAGGARAAHAGRPRDPPAGDGRQRAAPDGGRGGARDAGRAARAARGDAARGRGRAAGGVRPPRVAAAAPPRAGARVAPARARAGSPAGGGGGPARGTRHAAGGGAPYVATGGGGARRGPRPCLTTAAPRPSTPASHAHRPRPRARPPRRRRRLRGGDARERPAERARAGGGALRRRAGGGRPHALRADGDLPHGRGPRAPQGHRALRRLARRGGADDGRAAPERPLRGALPGAGGVGAGDRLTAVRFEFAAPTRIVFGEGALGEAGTIAAGLGRRAFVVEGAAGRADPLVALLAAQGVAVERWRVAGEPGTGTVEGGAARARRAGCDCVAAFGGGSVIDAAKAVSALLTNPEPLHEYLEVVGRGRPLAVRAAPLLAIPTTAGTGAEVTRNAVLAVEGERVKVSLRSALMLPAVALVDPELTHSLPPALTASTGLDALTQCLEPFVSPSASPLSDAVAREGLGRAGGALRRAVRDGGDREARRDMAVASLCGGLALANARLGAVHGFARRSAGCSRCRTGSRARGCSRRWPPPTCARCASAPPSRPPSRATPRPRGSSPAAPTPPPRTGAAWLRGARRRPRRAPSRHYGVTPGTSPRWCRRRSARAACRGTRWC